MENKVNYTVVGLFVVIFIIAFIAIAFWLSSGFTRKEYKTYLAYMDESVSGLDKNAPVKYNGVKVGFVSDIQLNLADPQQVILTLKIEPQIPITETTTATLTEQGITGIAYINLTSGENGRPLRAKPSEEYPVIKTTPSFLVRLDITLQSLTTDLSSLSKNVQHLVSEENIKRVNSTLQNLDEFSKMLAENNEKISDSLQSINVIMKNGAIASKEFPQVMKNIQSSAHSVNVMANDVSQASKTLNSTLHNSKAAVQSLQDQLMPEAYDTLDNMNKTAENLQQLTKQLTQNPAILIRGQTRLRKGPGE